MRRRRGVGAMQCCVRVEPRAWSGVGGVISRSSAVLGVVGVSSLLRSLAWTEVLEQCGWPAASLSLGMMGERPTAAARPPASSVGGSATLPWRAGGQPYFVTRLVGLQLPPPSGRSTPRVSLSCGMASGGIPTNT